MFNSIRKDFPIIYNSKKPLIYFDNAATTQKPKNVIDILPKYYSLYNANHHRGVYDLSVKSTQIYDSSKTAVKNFIGANSIDEIIYTKNATESLNLLVYSLSRCYLKRDDEIVLSIMEHHSNLVPWQQICKTIGCKIKFLYVNDDYRVPDSEILNKITSKTKVVSIVHMSNGIGTLNPIKKIIDYAHSKRALTIIDAAQSVPHIPIDVKNLDADFLVFSAHKMYGPYGIGVLYGKKSHLETICPFLYGGDMIEYVYEDRSTFAKVPTKFEAGTQNVEAAMGLEEAIKYLTNLNMDKVNIWEMKLTKYLLNKLKPLDYISVYGPKDIENRGAIISFNMNGVHPHDLSSILNHYGICVRSGNHCTQPLMRYLKINSTVRVSFSFYNTMKEIDFFIDCLDKIKRRLIDVI